MKWTCSSCQSITGMAVASTEAEQFAITTYVDCLASVQVVIWHGNLGA